MMRLIEENSLLTSLNPLIILKKVTVNKKRLTPFKNRVIMNL